MHFWQVWGRKAVRIFAPELRPQLQPFPSGVLRNTSQLDRQEIASHLKTSRGCWETVLGPGTALFMPPRFWHDVLALDGSLSLSFWWT